MPAQPLEIPAYAPMPNCFIRRHKEIPPNPKTGKTKFTGCNTCHPVVTKEKALSCRNCHAQNGVLNFRALGYSEDDIRRLTSAEIYFDKMAARQREEW